MPRSSARQDVKRLLSLVRSQGGTVTKKGSNHYVVKMPDGTTTIASSPSDWRAFQNILARLRKIGVDVSSLKKGGRGKKGKRAQKKKERKAMANPKKRTPKKRKPNPGLLADIGSGVGIGVGIAAAEAGVRYLTDNPKIGPSKSEALRPGRPSPERSAARRRSLGLPGKREIKTGKTVKYRGFLIMPVYDSDRGDWRADIIPEDDALAIAQERAEQMYPPAAKGMGNTEAGAVRDAKSLIDGDFGRIPSIHDLEDFVPEGNPKRRKRPKKKAKKKGSKKKPVKNPKAVIGRYLKGL